VTPATVVDHDTPHRGDWHAFIHGAVSSLCVDCHNGAKRSVERRGYDNTIGPDGFPIDRVNHPAYRRDF
jgi:hypothetical protein